MFVEGINPMRTAALASVAISRMQSQAQSPATARLGHESVHSVQQAQGHFGQTAENVRLMGKVVDAFSQIASKIFSNGDEAGLSSGSISGEVSGPDKATLGSNKVLSRAASFTDVVNVMSSGGNVPVPEMPASPSLSASPKVLMFS